MGFCPALSRSWRDLASQIGVIIQRFSEDDKDCYDLGVHILKVQEATKK